MKPLKPKSLSTAEYLEILIKTEKDEKSPGFEDRIVGLEKMKQETLILEKIAKGENLFETERRIMEEREKRMEIMRMKKATEQSENIRSKGWKCLPWGPGDVLNKIKAD